MNFLQLNSIETKEVNVNDAVKVMCKVTDEILQKHNYNLDSANETYNFDKIENSTVFLTGFTGSLGCYMARALLKRNNTIYCLVRGNPSLKLTAKERFETQCERILTKEYEQYINKKIHFIEGVYSKDKFGINGKDYTFLCENIDIILSVGCRVTLTMSWSQAVMGILKVTNMILELAVTYKHKAILHVSSCASNLPAHIQSGRGFCHGYALAKKVDLERLKYFYNKTKHALKIVVVGYLNFKEISAPNGRTIASFIFSMFQLKVFPNINVYLDYTNPIDACKEMLNQISFKQSELIYGVYSDKNKSKYTHFNELYKLMKDIEPELQLVTWKEFIDKLQNSIFYQIALSRFPSTAILLNDPKKSIDLLFTPPTNNLANIGSINKEMMIVTLKYIHSQPVQSFFINTKTKYFGYKWWIPSNQDSDEIKGFIYLVSFLILFLCFVWTYH